MGNRAAFSSDDVEDARRGHPAAGLTGYAQARDLRYVDRATVGGYRAALPCEPAFQFNVMAGWLPGGEHGVLAHEALALPRVGDAVAWSCPLYGLDTKSRGGGRVVRDVALALLPGGDLFTGWGGPEPDVEPVRAPCTVAAVRVPESSPVQAFLRIDTVDQAPPFEFGNQAWLEGRGVPLRGWLVQGQPDPAPDFLAEVLADPVGPMLEAHGGAGLLQLVLAYGTLVVRRNGFLAGEAQLDDLASFASLLAGRVRTACRARVAPQPFGVALPPPTWRTGIGGTPAAFEPEPHWQQWATDAAARYGLELEDPFAYHHAFPSVPVPGFARVVLRGTLPGLGLAGRLVVHQEPGGARPAVVLPVAPGARATSPDGDRVDTDPPVRVEVRDGLAGVWSLTSYWGNAMAGDVDAFLASAARVLLPPR